ncbi:hypothetical protein ITI46_24095 [Streptomyces oryzae]|uniref:Transmembrane protein n=2 Tax=Streptomyces oryzae TaxID=1434886 RepID=A0ABS3XH33_9ACTN|nr:hypothetical protein [Streptomyces oryzae]
MNSAPHLLREDRPEFERVLDEALRTAHRRPDLAAIGQRLNAEQLRTMALSAATAIAACAEAEYRQFVRLREELRRPENAPSVSGVPGGVRGGAGSGSGSGDGAAELRGPGQGGGGSVGEKLVGAMGGESLAEASGAGLVAVVSVLAPVLAATAAVVFLLLGYALRLLSPEPAVAGPIRSAGWVFAAFAAAGILVAMAGLLLTALRNGASAIRASGGGGKGADPGGSRLEEEVALARAAWRQALLERGIVPFLREALADPDGPQQAPAAYVPQQSGSRLGYSHPGFSSRPSSEAAEESHARPRFSSPDYSSPEYGGPETPTA